MLRTLQAIWRLWFLPRVIEGPWRVSLGAVGNGPDCLGTPYLDQAGLELSEILFPLSPQCWDKRCTPPSPVWLGPLNYKTWGSGGSFVFLCGFAFSYMNVCQRCMGGPTIATVCVEANFLFLPPWVLKTKLRSFDLVMSTFLCTALAFVFRVFPKMCNGRLVLYALSSLSFPCPVQLHYVHLQCYSIITRSWAFQMSLQPCCLSLLNSYQLFLPKPLATTALFFRLWLSRHQCEWVCIIFAFCVQMVSRGIMASKFIYVVAHVSILFLLRAE